MQDARDEVYCHLTARRAVARAALHLGIETMSQEALDTVADVLLTYLERIGQTLSVSIEASGRSSAHCNVLDCVRAVELCTEPAVQRVHLESLEDATSETQQQQQQQQPDDSQQRSWKGLASFCFGPNWNQSKEPTLTSRAGGKVGPSSTEDSNVNGWNAPYPDELPLFPITTRPIANPHPLPESAAESLHAAAESQQEEKELNEIPDAVFAEGWGSLSKKRVHTPEKKPPANKKAKLGDGNKNNDRPLFVPVFFPAFPKASDTFGRIVLDVENEEKKEASLALENNDVSSIRHDPTSTVRSALVELGQHEYWGRWEDNNSSFAQLAVPGGQVTAQNGPQPQIVPLGRASGSRVSRILEGSMDATNMQ